LSTLLERFITHFSRDPFTYTTHPALFSTVLFALPAPSLPAAGLPGVGFAILAELALQSSFMLFVPAGVRATTLGAALYYFFNAFFVAAGVEEFAKVWAMRCQKAICSSSCCFRLCNWNSDPNAKCCGRAAARFFCAAGSHQVAHETAAAWARRCDSLEPSSSTLWWPQWGLARPKTLRFVLTLCVCV
jgi:hypothetical protein